METQLKFVSKEKAHEMIDKAPGRMILMITYNQEVGISDCGKYIRKKKGKKLVDRASAVVLVKSNPVIMLNLHSQFMDELSSSRKEKIVRLILLTG